MSLTYALVRHPAVSGGAGRCYGRFDLRLAKPKEDIPALDAWAADLTGFATPGGESGAALIARVSAFWASITAQGGDHVIITHGGPLKVLLALAEGKPVDLSRPAPAMGQVIRGTA